MQPLIGTALLFAAASAAAAGPNVNLTRAAGNQYETSVAIDPTDNNCVFVVSRNEAGGLYTARSSDGGATWNSNLIARNTVPAPGDLPRAYGNASAAWDAFGNLFLVYLSQSTIRGATYVTLALSRDGGGTFYSPAGSGPPMILPSDSAANLTAGDQPTVAAGHGSAGFPGSVWVTYWTMGGITVSGAGVSGPGVVGPFTTWQPPQPPSVNFGDVAVGPAGEVMVTYGPNSGSSGVIYTNVKADGLGSGAFSPFRAAVPVNVGGFSYIPAQPNWGIDPEAGLAWDCGTGPFRGRAYLVYTDAPAPGSDDTGIFVARSDDMGATWSRPVRVNDDKTAASQFLPRISLDQSSGTVAVTWYDARDAQRNETARYYGAFSTDGGASFTANFPISTGTSNQAASGFIGKKADYGDYTGAAFAGGRMVAAWADNSNSTGDNPDGATDFDVYASVVRAPAADARPHISPGGVITAGAFGGRAGLAPGTWIEIYGDNLAPGTRDWAAADFSGNRAPTRLDGVEVTVDGKPAAISHIGPGQVNAQVPDGIGTGPVPVTVINGGVRSDPAMVDASALLPALFAPAGLRAGGRQYAAALAAGGSTLAGVPGGLSGGRPARPGELIVLYGTGFGAVTPPVPAGTIPGAPAVLENQLTVHLEDVAVDLTAADAYAGLAPGSVGLYQFNFRVPDVPDGDHRLRLTVGGVALQQELFISTSK